MRYDRAWPAVIIFLAMITAFVSGKVDIMLAAFLAAGGMIACRCISTADARKSVDWSVLLAIGASFGVGRALEVVGRGEAIRRATRLDHATLGPDSHDGGDLLRHHGA